MRFWNLELIVFGDGESGICLNRAEKLKENVGGMFGLPYSLKLINAIQRIGLDYNFHNGIKSALEKIYSNGKDYHVSQNGLTIKALKFGLFRYQDVLKSVVEEINKNTKGLKTSEAC
ncbi:hypothetical protein C5167_041021 [Papaver somniferum]|uniref:Terpene synthase N-terminal domain-containing protein n=1 Tax=Papaver somniferum TaxID=3469 RepID=A0A4Y7IGN9_PAPSO|nr:hypothetical protein C5167_041021 [Papaver somniferum]